MFNGANILTKIYNFIIIEAKNCLNSLSHMLKA